MSIMITLLTGGNTWTLAAAAGGGHEHLTSGSFVAAAAALPLPSDHEEASDQHGARCSLYVLFICVIDLYLRGSAVLLPPDNGKCIDQHSMDYACVS